MLTRLRIDENYIFEEKNYKVFNLLNDLKYLKINL